MPSPTPRGEGELLASKSLCASTRGDTANACHPPLIPLQSQGILAIAASLGSVGLCTNNTTLTELGVTRNRMGNFGLACLAKALKTNTSLRSLDISDDPTIQEEGFCELFLSLERNTTLDKLACKIMKPWPNAMGAMSRLLAGGLTSVCLSGSILGEVGIDLLVAALASEQEKRHSLTNLDLSKCHMESEGEGRVPALHTEPLAEKGRGAQQIASPFPP